jgi:hypothetical protein
VEAIRHILETTAATDDRVWLARANLAARMSDFDEAARWLDACQERRPDDPVVWRARLKLAMTVADVEAVWCALDHLPGHALTEAETFRLRGWLAARLGDTSAERIALLTLNEQDPGDARALERLAALAGEDQEAAMFRRRQEAVSAVQQRYRNLLDGSRSVNPGELARLAETLGRWAEARGWALIRDRKAFTPGPARPSLVTDESTVALPPAPERKLSELFADLRRPDRGTSGDRRRRMARAAGDRRCRGHRSPLHPGQRPDVPSKLSSGMEGRSKVIRSRKRRQTRQIEPNSRRAARR